MERCKLVLQNTDSCSRWLLKRRGKIIECAARALGLSWTLLLYCKSIREMMGIGHDKLTVQSSFLCDQSKHSSAGVSFLLSQTKKCTASVWLLWSHTICRWGRSNSSTLCRVTIWPPSCLCSYWSTAVHFFMNNQQPPVKATSWFVLCSLQCHRHEYSCF